MVRGNVRPSPRPAINTRAALAHLRKSDPAMGLLIAAVGPFRLRPDPEEPFLSLLRAITYQQLSGKAAGTIFRRFLSLFDGAARDGKDWSLAEERAPDPAAVLGLDDETLRSAGLSRQKVASIRDLAAHALSGELDAGHISRLPDEEVIAHLTRVRGVGRWTAEMYLIFHLGRPDVLPVNDLGINRGIQLLYGLPAPPKPAEVLTIGGPWRPWATVACWYLWRSQDMQLPVAAALDAKG